jgi:hypothetical protein
MVCAHEAQMDVKLAWLALCLVTACASSVEWQKPGATQASSDSELQACRLAAQNAPALPRPQTAPTSQANATEVNAERLGQEAQRVQDCMQKRGYRLVAK